MALCLVCSSAIIEDAQYYMTCNIGPEIGAVFDRNLGHEFVDDGLICSQCFNNAVQDVPSTSPINIRDDLHILPLETNVCVHCRTSLFNKRCQMVGERPQQQFISDRIFPRIVPDGSRVCHSCWTYIQKTLQAQGITNTPPVNTNICVWCEVSLAKRRRHALPEGPERDEIVQRIRPRGIPPGGLVCYTCWVKARRNVQRASNRNNNNGELPEPGPSHSHYKDACVWCGISLFRRHTHILKGPEKDQVATKIYPSEMPQHALACSNCFARAQEIIQIERGHVLGVGTNNPAMTLDKFSHTTRSSGHCFVPGCQNLERHMVPDYIRRRILKSQKVFVTENSRICAEHKCVLNWEFLDQHEFSKTFNKLEMESMLNLSIQEI